MPSTNPCPRAPHLYGFWTLPGTVIPTCSDSWPPFQWRISSCCPACTSPGAWGCFFAIGTPRPPGHCTFRWLLQCQNKEHRGKNEKSPALMEIGTETLSTDRALLELWKVSKIAAYRVLRKKILTEKNRVFRQSQGYDSQVQGSVSVYYRL